MARLPSTKSNLNLRTDQYTNSNIGTSTMATDQQEARVIGIPGKDGSNAGSGIYNNTDPVPFNVGGIEAGSTFYDVPLEEMWDKLLYPYVQPTFSSFSMTGQSTTLEVGIPVTGGLRDFTWTTTYPDNINLNSITVKQEGTILASSLANDGAETIQIYSDVNSSVPTTETWSIESVNTDATISSRNFTVSWKYANHYGVSANSSLTDSQILSLSDGGLVSGFAGTYTFIAGGYKYICYPTAFGLINTAIDQNTGFSVALNAPSIINITNGYGISVDYYVYRTTNIISTTITIVVS